MRTGETTVQRIVTMCFENKHKTHLHTSHRKGTDESSKLSFGLCKHSCTLIDSQVLQWLSCGLKRVSAVNSRQLFTNSNWLQWQVYSGKNSWRFNRTVCAVVRCWPMIIFLTQRYFLLTANGGCSTRHVLSPPCFARLGFTYV